MEKTKGEAVEREKIRRALEEATPETRQAVIDLLEKRGYLPKANTATT